MTDLNDYRPVRVIAGLSVAGDDLKTLEESYPNGEPTEVSSHGAKTGTVSRSYKPGQVIDAPTPEERVIFDLAPDSVVADIPQHDEGFDDPRSGLARSRASSELGRHKFIMETTARANKAATSAKPKKKSSKKKSADKSTKKGGDR